MSVSRSQKFEATLLESGAREAPSAERRRAARAAVMSAAGVGAATAAASLATTKVATKVSLLIKVVLLSAIASGVVGGALFLSRGREAPVSKVSIAPPPVPVIAPREEPSAGPIDVAALPSMPGTEATSLPAASAARPIAPGPARAVDSVDPVAAEARLLESARRCLTAGDVACARAKLAEHRSRFHGGALEEEARVLEQRIQRSGDDR